MGTKVVGGLRAGQCVTAGTEMTFPQSALITITLLRCLVKAVTNW